MKLSNKWFSFVEILIVVTILAVISIIASTAYSSMQTKSTNAKVVSDLRAINNSLESYSKENQALPMPKGNLNYYKEDTSYSHNLENSFWVSGYFFEWVLPKKYLSYLPYDPKTSQLYAYAKTNKQLAYEVWGVIYENELPVSVVMWNWWWEYWPYNLIKEYSGPNFVSEWSKNYFPYNPYEKRLVAKINSFSWTLKIDDVEKTLSQISDLELIAWNKIEISAWWFAEIYISDWSSTIIWDKDNISTLELKNFNFKDNTNIFTSVKLALLNWSVWTKAAKLDNNSSFEVSTPDTVAAVRWTIFWVTKNSTSSQVTLIEWKIDVKDDNNTPKQELQVDFWDTPKWVIIEWSDITSWTWNISKIPDEVKDKATTWIADFNENIQLKILSKTWSTLEIELNDITTKFNKLFVDEKEIESSKYSKNDNILSIMNLDFTKVNKIKLCKDNLCSKTLELSPLDSNLSFNDISKKDKILALNDPDNIEVEDLEEVKSEIEDTKCSDAVDYAWFKAKNCLFNDDYELIWYAPYDVASNYSMYTNSWSITNNNMNLNHAERLGDIPDDWSWNWARSNFYYNQKKSIWWILIDNKEWWVNPRQDYLYYEKPFDGIVNGAVEIWVRWEALKRKDWETYTLFSFWNNKIYLHDKKIKFNSNKIFEINDDFEDKIKKDEMYMLVIRSDNQTMYIKNYNWVDIFEKWGINQFTFSGDLCVWVNCEITRWNNQSTSYSNQWNDIIDYVKIYKKDLPISTTWSTITTP